MRRRRREHSIEAEIPTSSTGDIAFLLIIFFVVTASFAVTKGLAFNLPPDDPPQSTEGKESVLIEIQGDGSIVVDCRPMEAEAILDYLEPKLLRNPGKPIVLYAHPGAKYQDLVAAYEWLYRVPDRGLDDPRISIPTPDDLADYVRIFGFDPFAAHCGG